MSDAETGESPEGRLAAAKKVKEEVDVLAAEARRRYERALRESARRWAKAKFLFEQSFAHLGLLLYAVVALAGIFYVAGYYDEFGVAILDLYETPDFLLSATSSVFAVLAAVAGVGAVLGLLLWSYGAYVKADVHREKEHTQGVRRWRGELWIVGACALVVPMLIAFVAGCVRAGFVVDGVDKRDFVRVALRGNAPSSAIALPEPGRTILAGTTNRFHVFYECEALDEGDAGPNCPKGTPYIVATENVAAIDYDHETVPKPSESDIAAAIRALGQAVSGMGRNTTIDVGGVDAEFNAENLAGAIADLADAVDPLTIKTEIDPSDLTVKAVVHPIDVSVKADVEVPEVTVRTEVVEGAIPLRLHQNAPYVVVLGGATGVAPVNVVPFDALNPLATSAQGISIGERTRGWLGAFYESLSGCPDVRLRVTGHASRKGFGDPEHRSVWKKVLRGEEATARMNCGLANLRAGAVVSALLGHNGAGHRALTEAEAALDEKCSDGETGCLLRKAVNVRDEIIQSWCPPAGPLEWQGEDGKPDIVVHAWEGPADGWSGVGDGTSRLLSRTVHVSVDGNGDRAACPQLWSLGGAQAEDTRRARDYAD